MISDNVSLQPLWIPSRSFVEQSNFKKFQNWLFVKKGLYFRNYQDLWDWSVTDLEDFWECVWQFSEVKSHSIYWDILVNSKKDFANSQWFAESRLNYAEHIFRHKNNNRPALLYQSNTGSLRELSWQDLEKQVASVAAYLQQSGVGMGDKVVAIFPSGLQAVVAFLATNAIGAVWLQCLPKMITSGVLDSFLQIKPKVLFTVNGYFQNDNFIDKSPEISKFINRLPSLKATVSLSSNEQLTDMDTWQEVLATPTSGLEFTPVPFEHPLCVQLGNLKSITYNVGGCLVEHLKVFSIHHNFKAGDRFFWYDTTDSGTFLSIAAMLTGAIPLLYNDIGSEHKIPWELIEKAKINHFGIKAAFLAECAKQKTIVQEQKLKFNHLQSITAIGEGLSNEDFEWIYQNIKKEIWVNSFVYLPEINSSCMGNSPTLPIYGSKKQELALGCKIDNTKPYITFLQPMPSLVQPLSQPNRQ